MTCLLQWFLVILPFVPGIVNADMFQVFVAEQPSSVNPTQASVLPPWIIAPLVVVITFAAIVATLVSIFRAPKTIGETAQKITHSVAHRALPVVTHHKKISKKKQLELSARIIFNLKLSLLALPLVLTLLVPAEQIGIPRELLIFMVAILAGWALFLFCLQVALARVFRIPLKQLW